MQIKLVPFKNHECPNIKNHSAIYYKGHIYLFGGYDGKKNHNTLHMFNIERGEWVRANVTGKEPEGRNGHTATLVENKMYVIGGWLGSGTFASSDLYILNLDELQWSQVATFGAGPGPCNMHSADVVFVNNFNFNGGNHNNFANSINNNNSICNVNSNNNYIGNGLTNNNNSDFNNNNIVVNSNVNIISETIPNNNNYNISSLYNNNNNLNNNNIVSSSSQLQ